MSVSRVEWGVGGAGGAQSTLLPPVTWSAGWSCQWLSAASAQLSRWEAPLQPPLREEWSTAEPMDGHRRRWLLRGREPGYVTGWWRLSEWRAGCVRSVQCAGGGWAVPVAWAAV